MTPERPNLYEALIDKIRKNDQVDKAIVDKETNKRVGEWQKVVDEKK